MHWLKISLWALDGARKWSVAYLIVVLESVLVINDDYFNLKLFDISHTWISSKKLNMISAYKYQE